ncbi:TetR/AcrR family transcriptional regulator [Phenylobacterium koreense]|uniref:AcrR family transcriptional regulator n=1 Tax=Phenylobacterium koreense TaxID=266125 RepID=A0ABV2EMF3_9CAUL
MTAPTAAVDNAARVRRTQAERRDESGRRLLQAAAELIVERGVSAATFQNIGARAGYSRGLATQRFGSKQGLIDALVAFLEARQAELMGELDALPALDAVLAYVELFLRNLGGAGEARAYFMMMAGAVADLSPQRSAFAKVHEGVERRLEALIQRGQAEGTIRAELDADATALIIGSLLLGLSIQLLVDPQMNLEPIRETSLISLRKTLTADQ